MSATNPHNGNGVDRDEQPLPDDLQTAEAEAAAAENTDAEVVEELAPEEPKTPEHLRIEALERELVAANEKLRQYSEAVDKARSEFTASTARLKREQERLLDDQKMKLVEGLFGVSDTLHTALQGAGDGGQAFVDGITIVCNDFDRELAQLGLQRFDPTGETFDPERHDALTMMPVADAAHDGKIVQVVHAGAMVGEKVLRPAKVVVGKLMA